jgi:hypothetical protein
MIDDPEDFMKGIAITLFVVIAFVVGFNVRHVPEGYEVAPTVVEEEYQLTCLDVLKEQVALQRCEARYNCTLTPDDYRYGIEIADLREEMGCERKAVESPEEGIGDLQAVR